MGAPCALSPFSLLSSFIKEKSILSTITLVFFRAVASIIASEQGLYDYRHGHVDTIQFNTMKHENPVQLFYLLLGNTYYQVIQLSL